MDPLLRGQPLVNQPEVGDQLRLRVVVNDDVVHPNVTVYGFVVLEVLEDGQELLGQCVELGHDRGVEVRQELVFGQELVQVAVKPGNQDAQVI